MHPSAWKVTSMKFAVPDSAPQDMREIVHPWDVPRIARRVRYLPTDDRPATGAGKEKDGRVSQQFEEVDRVDVCRAGCEPSSRPGGFPHRALQRDVFADVLAAGGQPLLCESANTPENWKPSPKNATQKPSSCARSKGSDRLQCLPSC
jgi:hypothetical protein